jgi:hypothetical protein
MAELFEARGNEYNRPRPHSALSYRPPAPEAVQVAVGLTQDLPLPGGQVTWAEGHLFSGAVSVQRSAVAVGRSSV